MNEIEEKLESRDMPKIDPDSVSAASRVSRSARRSAEASSDENITAIKIGDKTFNIGRLAVVAARERRKVTIAYFLNGLFLVGACFASSLLFSLSIGLVSLNTGSLEHSARLSILSNSSIVVFVFVLSMWIKFVWLDGWLWYPPSRPIEGKRGTTRSWYDAITFMVNEEPAEVADGLTNALNKSIRSKIRAAMIFLWGLFGVLVAISVILSTSFNLIVHSEEFGDQLQKQVTESISWVQFVGTFAFSFGSNPYTFEGLIPKWVCVPMFFLAPLGVAYYSIELIKNARDMRWSLLSTPDILYKMLKNVLLVRMDSRDYTLEDAVRDAREYVFEYGLEQHPEDFIDMEGRLFFYSNNMRREFLKGSTHRDGTVHLEK